VIRGEKKTPKRRCPLCGEHHHEKPWFKFVRTTLAPTNEEICPNCVDQLINEELKKEN